MYIPFHDVKQVVATLRMHSKVESSWLLCVADQHCDAIPELLLACKNERLVVCGGVFPGLIDGVVPRNEGILAILLPVESKIFLAYLTKTNIQWVNSLDKKNHIFKSSITLIDCLAPNIDQFLEQIYDSFGSQFKHVGGGAGFTDLRSSPSIFTIDGWHTHAALLIALPSPMTTAVRHGWHRVAGPFIASRTSGHTIQELNWEPAGSFFRNQVALQNPSLADRPVFPDINSTYPLCISKEGSEDIMRDPIAISDLDELVLISHVPENSMLYLSHGDHSSLIEAAKQAISDCGTPLGVTQCFVSDCYSRALMLGGEFTRELTVASEALGQIANVRLEGIQALGEVAANGKQKLEFFNKTFVIGLLQDVR